MKFKCIGRPWFYFSFRCIIQFDAINNFLFSAWKLQSIMIQICLQSRDCQRIQSIVCDQGIPSKITSCCCRKPYGIPVSGNGAVPKCNLTVLRSSTCPSNQKDNIYIQVDPFRSGTNEMQSTNKKVLAMVMKIWKIMICQNSENLQTFQILKK